MHQFEPGETLLVEGQQVSHLRHSEEVQGEHQGTVELARAGGGTAKDGGSVAEEYQPIAAGGRAAGD
jgi:hypothetical protein